MQGTDSIILQVNQTVSAPAVTPFFKGIYEFKITSAQGDTTVKAYIGFDGQQVKFKYNKVPTGIVVDPANWVLNKTGTIINGGTILPVGLLSFEASPENSTAALKWKMSSEQQIKQYDIEYSSNGNDYTTVASVNSNHSDSESLYQYNYALTSAATHFFRLKIIANNGSYTYSQVLNVNKECVGSFSVNLSPNPVAENLYITIMQPLAGTTNIRILNPAGALIYKDSKTLNAGENKFKLDIINTLPKGVYLLRAENEHVIITKRFVKI